MSIANELITRGWTQGQMEDDDGRVCLVGAVRYACLDCLTAAESIPSWVWDQLSLLSDRQPALWNDRPERTFDDVLLVAKRLDEILDGAS